MQVHSDEKPKGTHSSILVNWMMIIEQDLGWTIQ